MKLNQCTTGKSFRITNLGLASEHILRVHELGLRPGVVFTLLRKVPPNGVVINIAGSRIAVDSASTAKIEVEVA